MQQRRAALQPHGWAEMGQRPTCDIPSVMLQDLVRETGQGLGARRARLMRVTQGSQRAILLAHSIAARSPSSVCAAELTDVALAAIAPVAHDPQRCTPVARAAIGRYLADLRGALTGTEQTDNLSPIAARATLRLERRTGTEDWEGVGLPAPVAKRRVRRLFLEAPACSRDCPESSSNDGQTPAAIPDQILDAPPTPLVESTTPDLHAVFQAMIATGGAGQRNEWLQAASLFVAGVLVAIGVQLAF